MEAIRDLATTIDLIVLLMMFKNVNDNPETLRSSWLPSYREWWPNLCAGFAKYTFMFGLGAGLTASSLVYYLR